MRKKVTLGFWVLVFLGTLWFAFTDGGSALAILVLLVTTVAYGAGLIEGTGDRAAIWRRGYLAHMLGKENSANPYKKAWPHDRKDKE